MFGRVMKQQITTLIACGVLAVALIGTAVAGPFEDGKLHIGARTTQKHFGYGVSWPIRGNARAQFSTGRMYYIGQSMLRDNAKADAWYRKAADQGF